MRWSREYHEYGTGRYVTKFVWWPLEIRGETRWFERTSWYEEWVRGGGPGACPDHWAKRFWSDNLPVPGDRDYPQLAELTPVKERISLFIEVRALEAERRINESSGMDRTTC